jgi:glycyl-tRNA synthetase
MREFEQMEMQYFVAPGSQMEHYEAWAETRMAWHRGLGIRPEKLRWHQHEKLAHYADAAQDVQYEYPMGWQEVEGIHSRTDYDLRRHQEYSGKKMEYFDAQGGERYIPYVVETSVGLDRTVLMLLCEAYDEDTEGGDERVVMRFHPKIAPITAAVFPLVKKGGMPEFAQKVEADLREAGLAVFYDEKGSIGKRYRRMDEAGAPFCITVDGETVDEGAEQGTVTVRDRDTLAQERVPAERLSAYLADRMKGWTREG